MSWYDSTLGGDDRLLGGTGADSLTGDAQDMVGQAQGGDDRLFGGAGADLLTGDASDRFSRPRPSGDLQVDARGGDDWLFGGTGADRLFGDAIAVTDNAVCGDDVLAGGGGDDVLAGDADPSQGQLANVITGTDRFVLANGSGREVVLDFEDGKDVIDLRGFAGINGFAEVRARATASDTVIDLGAVAGGTARGDALILDGFALARLDAADFLFA